MKTKIDKALILREAWHIVCIVFAGAIYGFSINNFLHGSGLLSGGFTGISLLGHRRKHSGDIKEPVINMAGSEGCREADTAGDKDGTGAGEQVTGLARDQQDIGKKAEGRVHIRL